MNDTITKPKRDVKKRDKSLYEIMHPKLDSKTETKQATEKDEWAIQVNGFYYFGMKGWLISNPNKACKDPKDFITRNKACRLVNSRKVADAMAKGFNDLQKQHPKLLGKNTTFTAIKVGKTTP